MSTEKQQVSAWLERHHRSREWLAEQCHVSSRTVSNWLVSPRPIPQKARIIIQSCMAADAEAARAASPAPPQNLVLETTPERFDTYNRAALSRRQTIREWAIASLNQAAGSTAFASSAVSVTPSEPPLSPAQVSDLERMADEYSAETHPNPPAPRPVRSPGE